MIGGMSWESTHFYYRWMNEYVYSLLGGLHSIEAVIYSLNFAPIMALVEQGEWKKVSQIITAHARSCQAAGAKMLILTSNAIHLIAEEIASAIEIPLIHIADPTGEAIRKAGLKKIGLLGTKITMEKPFYKERLKGKFGIEAIVPEEKAREEIHRIIFEELVQGKIVPTSKKFFLQAFQDLIQKGAEGIILGCTELNLLIQQKDTKAPLFDTTILHAKAAVDFSFETEDLDLLKK